VFVVETETPCRLARDRFLRVVTRIRLAPGTGDGAISGTVEVSCPLPKPRSLPDIAPCRGRASFTGIGAGRNLGVLHVTCRSGIEAASSPRKRKRPDRTRRSTGTLLNRARRRIAWKLESDPTYFESRGNWGLTPVSVRLGPRFAPQELRDGIAHGQVS